MAFDKKAYQKKYAAKWYKENKEATLERTKKSNKINRERNKDFVREIKESSPCVDCGLKYPHYVMDFDHLIDKVDAVAHMTKNSLSLETIQKEIDKCELVCSNCHRVRTWKRLKAL